jgi:hypothetical protein|tara:strand:- start:3496 stop:3786 length:291 start_codon:yes stop_codon:yes gene_type:complete
MTEDKIPEFKLDYNSVDNVEDSLSFHNRIIEFVTLNKTGKIDSEILCYFTDDEGFNMEAELPIKAYKQALYKSLEFFTEDENYEKCKIVKELIEII